MLNSMSCTSPGVKLKNAVICAGTGVALALGEAAEVIVMAVAGGAAASDGEGSAQMQVHRHKGATVQRGAGVQLMRVRQLFPQEDIRQQVVQVQTAVWWGKVKRGVPCGGPCEPLCKVMKLGTGCLWNNRALLLPFEHSTSAVGTWR